MLFHITPDLAAIQDAIRGTLAEAWPIERLQAFADGSDDLDRDCWKAMMELGLPGILAPDSGMGLLEAALACEVIGEAAANGPIIAQILGVAAVAASPTAAARVYYEKLLSGDAIATWAVDGAFVQSAMAATVFIADDGQGGLCLIEAAKVIEIEPVRSTDRSRPVSRVTFGDAPHIPLLAAGDPLIARLKDAALVLIAADALGGAQKVTDQSVAYARERVQFGQPIGRFQGLKHQLVQMAMEAEQSRAMVWYAAYAWDNDLPDAPRVAALAKAHLADVYLRCTRAAVQAHGGIGYTWEYGLHQWVRRALANSVWLGSPTQLRARAANLAGW